MRPILTIAIPTYNRAGYLKRCLQRVLEQTENKNIEIIVSDNASTDNTEMIVREFTKETPTLVYLKNTENVGPDRNFLNCYNNASGEYVFLLGDDDVLLPGAVDSILEAVMLKPQFIHLNTCSIINEETLNYTKPRYEENGLKTYTNKNEFLLDIGIYITFLSSLVMKTKCVKEISNKEQYIGTYFIQSHIALETMKGEHCYIVNTHNCVAAKENETVRFDVYYVWMEQFKKLLLETGTNAGFDRSVLENIYIHELKTNILYMVLSYRYKMIKVIKWNEKYLWENVQNYGMVKFVYKIVNISPRWMLPVYKKMLCFLGNLKKKLL